MSKPLNSVEIINRLKEAYDLNTDKKLAEFLEIPNNTLSNWKVRNTINWDLIHEKCEGLSWDYLRNGIGDPFMNKTEKTETEQTQTTSLGLSSDDKRQMLLQLLAEQTQKAPKEDHKISILFVDDEPNNLFSFKATFRTKYKIYTANNAAEALEILEDFPIEIIITDHMMPEMTGVELLERVTKLFPDPIRILLTGYSDLAVVREAINKGKIFYYLDKPWKENEIDEIILLAYAVYTERKKSEKKTSELEQLNQQLEFLLRQKLLS